MYNIKELKKKLFDNKPLKDDEYNALINHHKNILLIDYIMLQQTDYDSVVMDYMILSSMCAGMEQDSYLDDACECMINSFDQSIKNHELALEGADIATKLTSRYNVLNFVRQSDEVSNYQTLIGNLHETIKEFANVDYSLFGDGVILDQIEGINNSKEKIKSYSKKYFK